MAIIPKGRFKTQTSISGKGVSLPNNAAAAPYKAMANLGSTMAEIGAELYQRDKSINIRRESDDATAQYLKAVEGSELDARDQMDRQGNIIGEDGESMTMPAFLEQQRALTQELITDGMSSEAAEQFRRNVTSFNTKKSIDHVAEYHKIGDANFEADFKESVVMGTQDILAGTYQGTARLDALNEANVNLTDRIFKAAQDGQISEMKAAKMQQAAESKIANDAWKKAVISGNKEEIFAIAMSKDPVEFAEKYNASVRPRLISEGFTGEELDKALAVGMEKAAAEQNVQAYAKFRNHISSNDLIRGIHKGLKKDKSNKRAERTENNHTIDQATVAIRLANADNDDVAKENWYTTLSQSIDKAKTLGATDSEAYTMAVKPIATEFAQEFAKESAARSPKERAAYREVDLKDRVNEVVSRAEALSGITLSPEKKKLSLAATEQQFREAQVRGDIAADAAFAKNPADFIASIDPDLGDGMMQNITFRNMIAMRDKIADRNDGVFPEGASLIPTEAAKVRAQRIDKWWQLGDSRRLNEYMMLLERDTGAMKYEALDTILNGLSDKTMKRRLDYALHFTNEERERSITDLMAMEQRGASYARGNKDDKGKDIVNLPVLFNKVSEKHRHTLTTLAEKSPHISEEGLRETVIARFYALKDRALPNKRDDDVMEAAINQVIDKNFMTVKAEGFFYSIPRNTGLTEKQAEDGVEFLVDYVEANLDKMVDFGKLQQSLQAMKPSERKRTIQKRLGGDVKVKWSRTRNRLEAGITTPTGWKPLLIKGQPVGRSVEDMQEYVAPPVKAIPQAETLRSRAQFIQ